RTARRLPVAPLFRVLVSLSFWRRLLVGVGTAYVGVSLTLGGNREAKPVYLGLAISWAVFLMLHYHEMLSRAPFRIDSTIRENQRHSRNLERLEQWLTLLLLAALGAELSLRGYGACSGNSLVAANKLDAYRLLPGHDYGAGLRGNQLGYPGPDFRRAKRIRKRRVAAPGNSFPIGDPVPFLDNYLHLLRRPR